MRHVIPWAAALTLLAVACNDSGATATTSMAAITTITTATTGAAMAAAPTMEGWHLVTAADGQLGRGGGGGLKAVIEGGPGLLAFGEACGLEGGSNGGCYLGVWGSVDGTQWERLAELGSAEFWAVASLGSLVVVGGSSCSMAEQERGEECGPALWTSTDGIAWSWASSDDQVFVPCDEDDGSSCVARVEGIVELSSGGLWAYGFSALGSTTWSSRDGVAWELGRSSFTPFGEYRGGYRWLDQVFFGRDGLVASGTLMTGGPALGVTVEDFGDGEGVIVESVESDGSAAAGGIREGDVIVLVGGEQIVDFPTLTRLLNSHGVGDTVAIVVVRQDGEVEFDVALGGSEEWLHGMLMATSANGEQWTQLEPPLVSGGNVSFGWVNEWSGGLTAKADVCDQAYYCQQLSLTSTDGISWQTHRFRDAFGDVGLSRIYGFGSGRLGVGAAFDNQTGEGRGAFVASPDGDSWTLYLADPDVFLDAPWVYINDIIEFEDVTVAVGAADGGPAVWWYSG